MSSQAERMRTLNALNAKRATDGKTPCQFDPKAWDLDFTIPQKTAKARGLESASACLACHAYSECTAFAFAHPEIDGVIAGQLRGFSRRGPKPGSRRNTTAATPQKENEG